MKRILLLVLWISVAGLAIAKQPTPEPGNETAVRAAADAYLAAYNRGDAKAVADLWSEKGQWVTPSPERFQGRAAIRKDLQARFAENKKPHVELIEFSVRFVTPDVAMNEGRAHAIGPGQDESELKDLLSDKITPIIGSVDKEMQRVAMKIEGNNLLVAETGLYNLTNDEVPVLIQFGPDQHENRTLIRLNEEEATGAAK